MSAVDTLRDALFGNPPSPTMEPSREGTLAAFTELHNQAVIAMAAAAAGLVTVSDTSERDAFYADEANQGKLVYVNNNNGEPDDPDNGVYEYVDGAARIAEGFYQGVASVVQPLVGEAEAAALTATAAAEDVAGTVGTYETIGNPSPAAGTNVIASTNAVVSTTPVPAGSTRFQELRVYSNNNNNNARLVVYRPPEGVEPDVGVSLTRVVNRVIVLTTGENVFTADDLDDVTLQENDLIGISANGSLEYTAVSAGGPRYYILAGATPTIGSLATDNRWEWGAKVEVAYRTDNPLGAEVARLAQGEEAYWEDTTGFLLVPIVGQSNAAGRAESPSRFTIPENRSYCYDPVSEELISLVDPTGTDTTAQTGRTSIGPALAHAVLAATKGRIGVVVVNVAIGGTAISSWQTGSSSWTAATPKFDAAVADILAKKLNIVGCAAVMIQGETDGANGTAAATYKTGVTNLRDQLRTYFGCDDMPLIISQIGIDTDIPTDTNWAAIRAAQSELAQAGELLMAHSGAKYFSDRGLMIDDLHYSAIGLDEVGGDLGLAVLHHGLGKRPGGLDA